MVVWFRSGSGVVGIEDGVVRAADFAALTSLLEAMEEIEEIRREAEAEREEILASARARAEELLEEARGQLEDSEAAEEEARTRGYEEGLTRGVDEAASEWTERAVRDAMSTQRGLQRQTERLGTIVSQALDRVVEQEDRGALYRRAVRTISQLLKDVPMMTLRVPEGDRDSAQSAVDTAMQYLCSEVRIEVVPDASLSDGACLFESDNGTIDAGLETQLTAIKRALGRAAQQAASRLTADAEPAAGLDEAFAPEVEAEVAGDVAPSAADIDDAWAMPAAFQFEAGAAPSPGTRSVASLRPAQRIAAPADEDEDVDVDEPAQDMPASDMPEGHPYPAYPTDDEPPVDEASEAGAAAAELVEQVPSEAADEFAAGSDPEPMPARPTRRRKPKAAGPAGEEPDAPPAGAAAVRRRRASAVRDTEEGGQPTP
jgi:type III secretion protein L